MKTNREKKICDTVTLEQKVEDIENRARLLENERRDLLLQCSGRVHTSTLLWDPHRWLHVKRSFNWYEILQRL